MKTTVTSAQLTSNVERGGSYFAWPGQVVVLTCNETGTALFNWDSVAFQQISYNYGLDPEGTSLSVVDNNNNTYTANLTVSVMEGSVIQMTSTLMFTFTASLDGLTAVCRTLVNGQTMSRMASGNDRY